MLKVLKYMRTKEITLIIYSAILIVAQVYFDLKIPDTMQELTKLIITQNAQMSDIIARGIWMVLYGVISLALSVTVAGICAKLSTQFSQKLRTLQYNQVHSFSMQEINSFSTDSLITRSTNDITQVQMFIAMGLQILIKAPITAIWAISIISSKAWQWSTATGAAVIFLITVISIIVAFAIPKFKKIQTFNDKLNAVTRENLSGLRVVRAYNAEKYQENKFDKANKELTATHLYVSRIMAIMNPAMGAIRGGLSLAIYWVGAYLIQDAIGIENKFELFSNMVVFMNYAMQIVIAFMMLSMIFILLPRASVSAKRIAEVIDTKPSINGGPITTVNEESQNKIEFKNVYFKYPKAADYVLEDINFQVKKGETVAFIGSTGSGKTTLVNLIPRFYDVSKGEILIDGQNVKNFNLRTLNDKFGYVSQKSVMFSGTVSSNVGFGENNNKGYSQEQIEAAVEIAQGKDFVEKMQDNYSSFVARGGANLSGGQKQRLSIARAICKEPDIFIFDDSFSALDYRTDRDLRTALKEKTKGATTLIVAQRIGTIRDADKIVVIDEGKIVGIGTHKELMKNCSVYQEIALSQLSKEELE